MMTASGTNHAFFALPKGQDKIISALTAGLKLNVARERVTVSPCYR